MLWHSVQLEIGSAPLDPDARRIAVETREIVLGRLGVVVVPAVLLVRGWRVLEQERGTVVDEVGEQKLRDALCVERWRWWWSSRW